MTVPLSLALPAQPSAAAQARRFVARALDGWGLTPHLPDALIVASELVENAYKHAGGGCELRLQSKPPVLVVTVTDRSPTLPCIPEPAPWRTDGRGLLMIEGLADRWGIHCTRKGKAVWARLSPTPGRPPQRIAAPVGTGIIRCSCAAVGTRLVD